MAPDDGQLYQPLVERLEKFDALLREGGVMRGHEEEGIRTLRHALSTPALQHAALKYLAWTSTEFTAALVDDLVRIGTSDRYSGTVRELLGRLTHQDQQELVPPAVFKVLDAEHVGPDQVDYSDWRRMAEILYHLGMFDALRKLCDRARDSIDEDIREVAEDFGDA